MRTPKSGKGKDMDLDETPHSADGLSARTQKSARAPPHATISNVPGRKRGESYRDFSERLRQSDPGFLSRRFVALPGVQNTSPVSDNFNPERRLSRGTPDPGARRAAHSLIPRDWNLLWHRGYIIGGPSGLSKHEICGRIERATGYKLLENTITKAESKAKRVVLGESEALRYEICRQASSVKMQGSIFPFSKDNAEPESEPWPPIPTQRAMSPKSSARPDLGQFALRPRGLTKHSSGNPKEIESCETSPPFNPSSPTEPDLGNDDQSAFPTPCPAQANKTLHLDAYSYGYTDDCRSNPHRHGTASATQYEWPLSSLRRNYNYPRPHQPGDVSAYLQQAPSSFGSRQLYSVAMQAPGQFLQVERGCPSSLKSQDKVQSKDSISNIPSSVQASPRKRQRYGEKLTAYPFKMKRPRGQAPSMRRQKRVTWDLSNLQQSNGLTKLKDNVSIRDAEANSRYIEEVTHGLRASGGIWKNYEDGKASYHALYCSDEEYDSEGTDSSE